jgi:hypothetical protein
MKIYRQMTTKKSDDLPPYRPIEIEASELDKMDISKLASFNDLNIKDYRGGVLDLRFLDEAPTFVGFSVRVPDDDEASHATTEEWILPTHPSVSGLSLFGVRPDSSSIEKFSAWGLSVFALNEIDYTGDPYQHLSRLMVERLVLRECSFPNLPELKHVESIVIEDCDIEILNLNNISSKCLKNLDLDFRNLSNEHLRQIRQITSLEVLFLRGLGKNGPVYPALEGIDYSLLDGHPSLLRFDVSGIKGTFDVPHLPSLERLSLSYIESEEIDLSPLADSKNLRVLNISTYQKPSVGFLPLNQLDLGPLAFCTQLEMLHLTGAGVEEIDLTPLLHIESLDNLLTYDEPDARLFADSRFKDKVKSPSIKSLDKHGELEWR